MVLMKSHQLFNGGLILGRTDGGGPLLEGTPDISNSKGTIKKHFELSEVRDKQIVTSPNFTYRMYSFLESIFLQTFASRM